MDEQIKSLPYAPPSSVVGVIRRFRDRGITEPVTSQTLEQVGVSAGNAPRTLQALRFLGLINEEGKTTDSFGTIKRASTEEYPQALASVLYKVYGSVFNLIDPNQDDEGVVEDAFRGFEPSGQRNRMITLYLGLCGEAGLISEDKAPKISTQPRRQANKTSQTPKPRRPKSTESARSANGISSTKYAPIAAIVDQLPDDGTWTQKRRDLWMKAIESAVDLSVEVETEERVYEAEIVEDDPHLQLPH